MNSGAEKGGAGRAAAEVSASNLRCCQCSTEYSPFFHPVEDSTTKMDAPEEERSYECHSCYFKKKMAQTPSQQQAAEAPMLMAVEA